MMIRYTMGIPDVTATSGDYSEIVSIFSSMTIEEFDSYILSIIDGSIYEGNDNTIKPDNNSDDFIMPLAYIKEQRYYYKSGSNNYLFITSNMQYADSYDRYNSISSFGESVISYPAFKANSYSASFFNSYKNVNVTFNVTNYLTSSVYDTAYRTVSVTFSSTGGNIYGSVNL